MEEASRRSALSAGRWRAVNVLQRCWHALPVPLRERFLLLTQSTFTVGVSAVLLVEPDRVLLLSNRFRYSNSWELPGGFVRRGESLEDAVLREVREETGYSSEVLTQVSARMARHQHLDVCYLCRVTGGTLQIDEREITAARVFSLEDLLATMSDDQVERIRAAIRATKI